MGDLPQIKALVFALKGGSPGTEIVFLNQNLAIRPASIVRFSAAYARARRQQVEAWSDELLKIADDPRLEPNDRRVRLDTRKWIMARLNPNRWGDKVTVAGDPDAPLQHVVTRLDIARLSGPELDALERFTDARLAAKDMRDLKEGQ